LRYGDTAMIIVAAQPDVRRCEAGESILFMAMDLDHVTPAMAREVANTAIARSEKRHENL
jgi:hypothetical protein